MFEFLQRIFIGHNHKWIKYSEHPAIDSNGKTECIVVVLKCEICGNMKNHKISA